MSYQAGEVRHYDDDGVLLRAAIEGQGVTLTRLINAGDDLEAGRLVRLFDVAVRSAFQYYFVCPLERAEEPAIRALGAWLASSQE